MEEGVLSFRIINNLDVDIILDNFCAEINGRLTCVVIFYLEAPEKPEGDIDNLPAGDIFYFNFNGRMLVLIRSALQHTVHTKHATYKDELILELASFLQGQN